MATAKLFWSGRSQAVRLPKEFRLTASEVRIRRQGSSLVLEPIADNWGWLDAVIGPVDADFATAAVEQPSEQARPGLEFFQ
jgi:antitoxin VapB